MRSLLPNQNLRVMAYLKDQYELDDVGTSAWSRHWIETGFDAYEASIAADKRTGSFSHGDSPTMADLCLVPQLAFSMARRQRASDKRWCSFSSGSGRAGARSRPIICNAASERCKTRVVH